LCDIDRYYVRSTDRLKPGKRIIEMRFDYDGGGLGRGGQIGFVVDGLEFGSGRVPRTVPFSFSLADTLDIGRDRGASVTPEYPNGPDNAYQGQIDTVRFDLGEDRVEPTSAEKLRAALSVH
jgi:arylsulfatase